jgi:ASTRA-associated protein 1
MSVYIHVGETIRLVIGYESGQFQLWSATLEALTQKSDSRVTQSIWKLDWSTKGHNEAIMGLTVDWDYDLAYSVSADHLLVKYDLIKHAKESVSTKQIGNSSVAVHDGIVAVGEWDGK